MLHRPRGCPHRRHLALLAVERQHVLVWDTPALQQEHPEQSPQDMLQGRHCTDMLEEASTAPLGLLVPDLCHCCLGEGEVGVRKASSTPGDKGTEEGEVGERQRLGSLKREAGVHQSLRLLQLREEADPLEREEGLRLEKQLQGGECCLLQELLFASPKAVLPVWRLSQDACW